MDFKISRSQKQCSVCNKRFANREKYHVGLMPRPKEEGVFDRTDICGACWERQGPGALVAHWLSEFTSEKKPALMDPDLLWQVFHNARGENQLAAEDKKRFAYVAALGLMRLKQLKMTATKRTKAGEICVFQTPGKKPKDRTSYDVINPGIDEKGYEEIQDRLSELA